MSFFSRLSEIIGEEYSVQITVQKKDRNLSVSVLPKSISDKDTEGKKIIPIVVTGTPDQIDLGLISAIAQPVASLNQLVVSGDVFIKEEKKKTTEKSKPETKAESPQKTLEPTKVVEHPKQEAAKEPKVEKVKPTAKAPLETFDEDTGEVMPAAEFIEDEPEEEPEVTEKDPNQASMFDDEDWA